MNHFCDQMHKIDHKELKIEYALFFQGLKDANIPINSLFFDVLS